MIGEAPAPTRHGRDTRWARWIVALGIPTAIFAIVVTRGFRPWTEQPQQSRFYENQAESILHGHIDVPPRAIDPDGIVIDGKFYGYFGPTPALLRLPVMLFTSAPTR